MLALAVLLAACASVPRHQPYTAQAPQTQQCLQFLQAFDRHIGKAQVRDVQAVPVPGFAFLRVNRLLQALGEDLPTSQQQRAWVAQLGKLDGRARTLEWFNLPQPARTSLLNTFPWANNIHTSLEQCNATLRAELLENPSALQQLHGVAKVADDYSTAQRVLGLYFISGYFVSLGVERLHEQYMQTFATPLEALPVKGRLQRYAAVVDGDVPPVERPAVNSLGMPEFSPQQLQTLFARHAPVFEVDEEAGYDRIGRIGLTDDGQPRWLDEPRVYRLLSYTLFDGEVLPQLVYVAWFSQRPPLKRMDIYAGKLDGLIWRVTLDSNLQPLIYDSVHSCGCYHKFYPGPQLTVRDEVREEAEPPYIAQEVPRLRLGERRVIRISSGRHFVQRVYKTREWQTARTYELENYDALRSIRMDKGGSKSLFGSDALVAGSERPERWLFWPSGVVSAGAMRQWGHHPIAFVGRRHLDEPFLMEKFFRRKQSTPSLQ